ncbi:receptor-like protein 33 [Lactuca sativa]|uniref:receptor-like protein 33 n=1 Tax=Lactuca sativa TaxID=4236 RepID=UPI0022AEC001|nr:receptor-like protein 33 [Lactuca sativa]
MTNTDGEASGKKHPSFTVLSLDPIYYQDNMTVTIKGLELELVKILTIFTSINISSNHFSSEIPDTIRRLNALYMFNVSHNDFTGLIPPSIGNLSQLESLDMSWNKLTGDIPSTLTNLSFLSSFNLSYNQLEGRIPTGSQFQTFQDTSYKGNIGLCGSPWMNTNKDVDMFVFSSLISASFCIWHRNLYRSYSTGNNLELAKCHCPCIQNISSVHINCGGPRVTNGKKTYEADEDPGGPAIFVLSNENYWGYSSTGSIWKV